jgi:predicted dehydrogenase
MLQADWTNRTVRRSWAQQIEDWTLETSETVKAALDAFLHAVRTKTSPPVTGLDGCRAVELADACYESAESAGRWITLKALR